MADADASRLDLLGHLPTADGDSRAQEAHPLNSPPLPVSRRSSAISGPPGFVVGHPPNSPSPLAIRASRSPSSKRHTTQQKQLVDLRQVEYVSKVDDNLVCLICHCPFDTPRRVVTCDHVFCKDCLQNAFAAQNNPSKTCPTCRTCVERDPEPVQRLLTRMLDELVIKCPNHELGCEWENKRADVQDHVEIYCKYTMVPCPDPHCHKEVMQKEYHRGCLHQTVVCQHCHTSMMKQDLDQHERDVCPNRFANCPHCSVHMTRYQLPTHLKDDCPRTVVKCKGHVCGCPFEAERSVAAEHSKSCPMSLMAPTVLAQIARQDEQDRVQKLLQRKVDILEGSLAAMQSMLYHGSSPPAPPPSANDPFASASAPATEAFPSLDSQADQIISLHDSLREELNRTNNSIADLDGRVNMLFLNEQQRNRDDMAYLTNAIGTLRMQLHWLITSGRTQAYSRATTPNAQATHAALNTSSSAASGSSSGGTTLRRDGLPPLRRLSDSSRQDTKL